MKKEDFIWKKMFVFMKSFMAIIHSKLLLCSYTGEQKSKKNVLPTKGGFEEVQVC